VSVTLIAAENIPEGSPVMIEKWPFAKLVTGDNFVDFIANKEYKKDDEIELVFVDGNYIDLVGDLTTDNPKTWPIFSPMNKRFWVWFRSLMYGFIRKLEDAYNLEPPHEKSHWKKREY